jgi:uncharacterized protein (TIGR03435 family)
MLQRLLVERFQISLHREMKQMPVYRLKLAKNGPKLKPAEDLPTYADEDERREATRKGVKEALAKTMAVLEAEAQNGIRPLNRRWFNLPRGTIERFAEVLSRDLDRPVKDMTQVQGEYSFHLEWNPDARADDDGPEGVSIFTAIQQQLGLRLEGGNDAIELLVIDKAEKTPISN